MVVNFKGVYVIINLIIRSTPYIDYTLLGWRTSRFFDSFATTAVEAFSTCFSSSTSVTSMWQGDDMYALMRPWARYVRLRCLGAWLTCIVRTISFDRSRPLASAFDSAFFSRARVRFEYQGQNQQI